MINIQELSHNHSTVSFARDFRWPGGGPGPCGLRHLLRPVTLVHLLGFFPHTGAEVGEQVEVHWVGGGEREQAGGLALGGGGGVAAGCHEWSSQQAGSVQGAPRVGQAQSISHARPGAIRLGFLPPAAQSL
jgi:hypothetical protein